MRRPIRIPLEIVHNEDVVQSVWIVGSSIVAFANENCRSFWRSLEQDGLFQLV